MIGAKPDFSRIATTLHHEEPDRVPLVEADVDYAIMSQFLGRPVSGDDLSAQVEFWSSAGYDFIPLTVGMMEPGRLTGDSRISEVIEDASQAGSDGAWSLERMALIRTEEDVDTFPWEEAAKLDCSKFHAVQPYLPEGMKIVARSGKIFTLTWMLMGFENFGIHSILKPGFVAKVLDRVARIQLAGLREVLKIPNVAAAWAVDDLAFGSGPMIDPRTLRRLLFPWYEEFGSICHGHGCHFFFHSDGVIWELIEDLIHLGVDALHPIDPTCMDIEEVKDRVGERLCLIGNISNEILLTGTPREVAELTKKRIKALAPGGGYCLGSGNSVPDWARIENYRAMIGTALEQGRYPIAIP
jgi:uroporphyrinogen decarboxylase